jgi:hypothetical protein
MNVNNNIVDIFLVFIVRDIAGIRAERNILTVTPLLPEGE